MKYLLTLDTYAHSAENTFYFAIYPTIKSLKQELSSLIKTGKITMKHDGTVKHKIYRATISKRINTGDWLKIKDTSDGIKWDKIEDPTEWDIYRKGLVASGHSFKDILM